MCAPNTQTATICQCDQPDDQGMEMFTNQGQVTEPSTEYLLLPGEEVDDISSSGEDEMQSLSPPCLGRWSNYHNDFYFNQKTSFHMGREMEMPEFLKPLIELMGLLT